jgi:Kef-type K+ transport system membrane component KefB
VISINDENFNLISHQIYKAMHFKLPVFELPFFTNLLILLVVAKILGELFERNKQPAMIGEILAGVILGPSLLNFIHRNEELVVISDLGVFFLVIIAGLEINLEDITKSLKGKNFIISIFAFFLPILSGFALGAFFGLDIMTNVFIGLCVAITALPVSVRILMDLGRINSETGKKIISIAIFDDLLALSILGVLLNLQETDMSLIAILKISGIAVLKLIVFLGILFTCTLLIKKYSKRENYLEEKLNKVILFLKSKESLYAIFFVFILGFATITESLGFHFIIGTFFAALLINENLVGKTHLKEFEASTSGFAMGFLAPIFFAGIGLEFQFGSIENYWLLIAIILVSFASKITGGYVGGRLAGLSSSTSLTLGVGLNARGIMELVIANIAYKSGLINIEIFSILVVMGLFTTLVTPLLLKKSFGLEDKEVAKKSIL